MGSYFILGLEDQGEQWLGAPRLPRAEGLAPAWVGYGLGLFAVIGRAPEGPSDPAASPVTAWQPPLELRKEVVSVSQSFGVRRALLISNFENSSM